MSAPFRLTVRHMTPSPAMEERIRDQVDKMIARHPEITSCHVVIDEHAKHKHQGRLKSAHITVHVPGHELAVQRDDEDGYVALSQALGAISARLEVAVRERRRTSERPMPPED